MAGEPIIIIKKIKKSHHAAHHGGAWKVAYADFVTAMMAFFLLLWLLNVTTDIQRKGIADYFAPANIAPQTSGAGGILGGLTIAAPGAQISERTVPGVDDVKPQPPGNMEEGNADKMGTGSEGQESGSGKTQKPNMDAPQAGIPEKLIEDTKAAPTPHDPLSDLEMLALEKEKKAKEEAMFEAAEDQLKQAIMAIPALSGMADNLLIDRTPEGLRIQIIDQKQTSMFPPASPTPYAATRQLMNLVGQVIAQLPNDISVSGHTDSSPFGRNSIRDNWDLSTERANVSRRMLTDAGVADARVRTVVGRADRDPLIKSDANAPQNRRISIILLRQDTPKAADMPTLGSEQPAAAAVAPPAPEPATNP